MKKTLEEKQAECRERHAPKPRPFEPGASGNPTCKGVGRPRAPLPVASAPEVRRQLAEMDPQGRTNFALIVAAQIDIAKKSKHANAASRAFDALMDRAFGRPVQQIDQNVTVRSREEELKFLLEEMGHKPRGDSSDSTIQ